MNCVAAPLSAALVSHVQTPSQSVQAIDVVVGRAPTGGLSLGFTLLGDLASLRVPAARTPARGEGLWRHTCFEAFVMAERGPGYREFNLSPSGEWAILDFRGYRDGAEADVARAPEIVVCRSAKRLQLDAHICQDDLPRGRCLCLGLSAVVEDAAGLCSYWALKHPAAKPDFHHVDSFAMQLDWP